MRGGGEGRVAGARAGWTLAEGRGGEPLRRRAPSPRCASPIAAECAAGAACGYARPIAGALTLFVRQRDARDAGAETLVIASYPHLRDPPPRSV